VERGQGTLSVTIEDGGVIESAAKPIPIIFHAADITFYPEGTYDVLSLMITAPSCAHVPHWACIIRWL